jgi:hypothetical protein
MARPPTFASALLTNVIDVEEVEGSRSRVYQAIRGAQYQPHLSLRENYLSRTSISIEYQSQLARLMTGQNVSLSTDWIISRDFYQGALGTAQNFISHDRTFRNQFDQERATGILEPGIAEYMQFFEVVLYRLIAESSRSLRNSGEIDVASYRYCEQLMCQSSDRVNQNIRQLFYHFSNGSDLNTLREVRWNSDFKKIIEMTIQLIQKSFVAQENRSDFLDLMPLLRAASIPRNNLKHWTWELRDRPSYLSLLFAITMIRFPTVNTSANNATVNGSLRFPFQHTTDPNLIYRTIQIRISNANLQSIFYFVPEMNRVFGTFPKNVVVRNSTDDGPRHMQINYKMNLIRNIVVLMDIPGSIRGNGYQISFETLFADRSNNLYRTLRRSNPFRLSATDDQQKRFYVSMTVYANQDAPIIHVPFILEAPINDATPFSVQNFCEEWERVLFNTDSGRGIQDRIADISQFAFYFCLIHDPTMAAIHENITAASGIVVGAPYAGTKKEKHFLDASLLNRFTNSPALFKTPQKRMHSCLMMSLIKCQLYCYEFDGHKCTNLKVTGTKHKPSRCENMYVECITNFDHLVHPCEFLIKKEDKWFVKMFEPTKYKSGEKFLSGSVNKFEEELWEMAAEEIWFAMEVHFEQSIDYTSLSQFGQLFANFFNVCIAVYDVEVRAQRCHVITPYGKTAKQLVDEKQLLLMIHIVYDQGHMHAITNFSSFIKADMRKDDLRLYNYCPICEDKQSQVLRENKISALDHISQCLISRNFKINYETEIELMAKPNLDKVRKAFRKDPKTHKFSSYYQCCQCFEPIMQHTYMAHCCVIQPKKSITIPESTIYVYDIEAAQLVDEMGLLKHECNCLYIRKVYCETEEEKQGRYFADEISFMEALLSEQCFVNALFIAHNGGSYDVHFLLRILERKEVQHNYVPSPTSKHKFIQIHITHQNLNIRFIDFMRFIPGSLKNIALAFEIEVTKGDFPHRFNNGQNDTYIGRIPPAEDTFDYWGLLSVKTEKDKLSFINWYAEQCEIYCTCDVFCNASCGKKLWNFQEEIRKYCLLDVIVLAEIVKSYRNACMTFEGDRENKIMNWVVPCLDPLQFMTLPQITINTLVNGFETMEHSDYDFNGIVSLGKNYRGGQNSEAIIWLYLLNLQSAHKILYLGNSLKEYYDFNTQFPIDGYCPETGQIFLFLDCDYWICPECHIEDIQFNNKIECRKMYASDIAQMLQTTLQDLRRTYSKVNIKWSHEFNTSMLDKKLLEMSQLMNPADCFYGGRTEVFQIYANAQRLGKEIHYYDVTSLYPSVYAHHELPLGKPIHLIGNAIDISRFHPTVTNRYYGFAKVHVVPRKSDMIGLLPKRDPTTGRLFFPVYPMVGCWFTTEIYLAMQNGYEVTDVYELFHWDERNRSDKHLGAYVNYFFQMKQEAEGWKKLGATSENPSMEEKMEIAERLYVQNGNLGRIRIDKVKKSPVLRALAKLYLNSLWGKLAQKPAKNNHMTIFGNQQLLDLIHNPQVILSSCAFREVSPGVYKSNFKVKDEYVPNVRHGNLFIGAAVTATARCVLHSKMLQVGVSNMIYCDTDSIIFAYDPDLGILTDVGLGKWTNEYPDSVIEHVYALAPKLYSLKLKPRNKNTYETFRAKGVQLTLLNQDKIKFEHVKQLITNLLSGDESNFAIEVDNMNIFTNSTNNLLPYGQLFTRYNKKKVRAIITKRIFEQTPTINWEEIASIQTFPYGYESM